MAVSDRLRFTRHPSLPDGYGATTRIALALLDKVTTAIEGLMRLAMQAGGRWFDMIELPGDDYAGNLQSHHVACHVPQIH